ncbi:hypothetical protein [Candidatus Ichthyocystis hellenicum]|uniref:hypothetical protein n=1 Tax=Candidatus Ichthyocystis hellenicum TaxID=1561003 RepID=UPI00158552BE|nr:hypothetical protein [Candidatus Ichthyocystis hellenicum]
MLRRRKWQKLEMMGLARQEILERAEIRAREKMKERGGKKSVQRRVSCVCRRGKRD